MGDATREERVPLGGFLIHVGIEGVTGEIGEVFDVFHRDGARRGVQGLADGQFTVFAGEGVGRTFDLGCAGHPFLADGREDFRAALDRGALHVVFDTTHAAHFLTAACAAGATVDHVRQGRAVSGAFLHGVAVVEVEAAVVGACTQNDLAGNGRVMGDDRGNQRALALVDQFDGVVEIAIAHDGRDRAEGFGVVHALGRIGVGAMEQHRRHEGAFLGVRTVDIKGLGVAEDALSFLADDGGFFQHVTLLAIGDQRTHAGGFLARIADHGFRKARGQGFDHGLHGVFRRDDTADGGTFLTGLGGHLALNLFHEEIEFGRTRFSVGAKDRGVETVLFGNKTDRVFENHRVRAQFHRGVGGTGEADNVLHG